MPGPQACETPNGFDPVWGSSLSLVDRFRGRRCGCHYRPIPAGSRATKASYSGSRDVTSPLGRAGSSAGAAVLPVPRSPDAAPAARPACPITRTPAEKIPRFGVNPRHRQAPGDSRGGRGNRWLGRSPLPWGDRGAGRPGDFRARRAARGMGMTNVRELRSLSQRERSCPQEIRSAGAVTYSARSRSPGSRARWCGSPTAAGWSESAVAPGGRRPD